jgi:cystathionine gamma-lyase
LEDCIAALEYGKYCISFSSGCSALLCVIHLLKTGEHLICCDDVYGGTQRYLRNFTQKQHGIELDFVDLTDLSLVEKIIKPGKTKLIWVETPTNPMLKLIDIEALCKIAKKHDILVSIDNTFATPLL